MSYAGCQINPINMNFDLQTSLEIFDKNSADKVCSKKDRGWKVPSLMSIRVKSANNFLAVHKRTFVWQQSQTTDT